MVRSVCDVFNCEMCSVMLQGRCPGCSAGNRAQITEGTEPCAIYNCATNKGLTSCGECDDTTCPFPRNLEMACPVRAYFEKKRSCSRKRSVAIQERQTARATKHSDAKISEKTVIRLQQYLLTVEGFLSLGIARISSEDIARKVGVKDYLIRHDLNQFGGFGRPSIGYDARLLRDCLAEILHLDEDRNMVWVGAPLLAAIPALLKRFEERHFHVVAIFDTDPARAPESIGDLKVLPLSSAAWTVREKAVVGAVLAVPQEAAQSVTDLLVGIGIRGILNITPATVAASPDVCIRHMDIVQELCTLAFHCRRLHGDEPDSTDPPTETCED